MGSKFIGHSPANVVVGEGAADQCIHGTMVNPNPGQRSLGSKGSRHAELHLNGQLVSEFLLVEELKRRQSNRGIVGFWAYSVPVIPVHFGGGRGLQSCAYSQILSGLKGNSKLQGPQAPVAAVNHGFFVGLGQANGAESRFGQNKPFLRAPGAALYPKAYRNL